MTELIGFAALQGPFIGSVLVASAVFKARTHPTAVRETALGWLVRARFGGGRRGRAVLRRLWFALVVTEGGLAATLWIGVAPRVVGLVALAFFVGAAVYLAFADRYLRGATCGCFGTSARPSHTSMLRVMCLAGVSGWYAVGDIPIWAVTVSVAGTVLLACEAVAFMALSNDLRMHATFGLAALRRWAGMPRSGRSLGFAVARERIETTHFWMERVRPALGHGAALVEDEWLVGNWRCVEYSGAWFGQPATIVGAVSILDYIGTWRVLVTIGNTEGGRIVAAYDSAVNGDTARLRSARPVTATAPLPA